jgi:hypothetical protein
MSKFVQVVSEAIDNIIDNGFVQESSSITAFRGDNTKSENMGLNKKLKSAFESKDDFDFDIDKQEQSYKGFHIKKTGSDYQVGKDGTKFHTIIKRDLDSKEAIKSYIDKHVNMKSGVKQRSVF